MHRSVLRRARGSRARARAAGGLGLAAVPVALALAARASGSGAFTTAPAGVVPLALAGGLLVLVEHRVGGAARAPLLLVRATGAGLVVYALLGAAAALAAVAAPTPLATALATAWGAAWIPPLVTTSAAALTASAGARWSGRAGVALLVLGGALVVAVLLLQEPVAPFAGLPPAAPEAWRVTGAPLLSALELLLACALLVAPLAAGSGAVRERSARTRARALLLATGAASPVLVVAVCLLLAVARDPGGVDPSAGSTGFLLALGVGCGAGGLAVRAGAGAGADDRDVPAAVAAARCLAAAVAVLAALATAVVAASLLDGAPRLVGVGVVALVAAGAVEAWRRASGWVAVLVEACHGETATAGARPVEVPAEVPSVVPGVAPAARPPAERVRPPAGWSELTPREREVLAELATGASNAGIAESLGISPRTVEAHLRSVFARLGLDPADGSNRRVVAARHWLEHGAPGSGRAREEHLGGSTDAARTTL